jgi:AraC-like DNA-binding protein
MLYREFKPGTRMQAWVAAYWHFRVSKKASAQLLHTIPLTGAAMMAAAMSGRWVAVTGPRITPLQIAVHPGDEFWGAHFVPGAAESLLGRTLRDSRVLADAFASPEWIKATLARLDKVRTLSSARQALDRSLSDLAPCAPAVDPHVMACIALIIRSRGALPISRIATTAGLSERQFRRRFRAMTGLSPKEYARVRRTRAALVDAAHASLPRWCEIALERGFTDQAHLIGEFRRTLGRTPRSMMEHVRRIRHGRVLA